MKSLLLLGSTGSIGTQTLDLVRSAPDRFRVSALTARSSWEVVLEQVREFRPAVVALTDEDAAERLVGELPPGVELLRGPDALLEVVQRASYDLAVHGVVGAAGLPPSVAVLERGIDLALANKESLVIAGAQLMELARRTGARILPVDSEHCAIYQCLAGEDIERVRCVYVTASGGSLRDVPLDRLGEVTPDEALDHPTWDMGRRITVDSATLMNKALEVIEAHHLYGLPAEKIRVVLHRQSVVHSMVEFVDGSVMAQMGPPDMRGPIAYALDWPERQPTDLPGFGFDVFRELTFAEPDRSRYPALELGYRCVERGGHAGCVLNAADEVAVQAFLDRQIGFQDIDRVNRSVLEELAPSGTGDQGRAPGRLPTIASLLESDREARALAADRVHTLTSSPIG